MKRFIEGENRFQSTLMKRLPNVQAEMSLHVLAYNMRRAINVLGVAKIMEQLQVA